MLGDTVIVDTLTGEIREPRQLEHPLLINVPRREHIYEIRETVVRSLTVRASDIAAASVEYEARCTKDATIVSRGISVKDKGVAPSTGG